MMGAGKTAVGRSIATRLGAKFVDLDDEIIKAANMKITEIEILLMVALNKLSINYFTLDSKSIIKQLISENKDSIKNKQPNRIITKKIGRNDPCPCGSGKKYKVCHGS